MSTAQSKPMGIQKKDYHEIQSLKAEEDFKYTTLQKLQNLQFAVEKLSQGLSDSITCQSCNKKDCDLHIEYMIEYVTSNLKEFRHRLGDMDSQFTKTNDVIKKVRSDTDDCISSSAFNEKISHLHDCIKRLHSEKDAMRKEFNGLIENLNINFERKLKAQKDEILAIPSEIPNITKVMDQKLELVELNGQNAVLRSSNNERHIMLLERKIDNLYQLVKNVEITNQEAR